MKPYYLPLLLTICGSLYGQTDGPPSVQTIDAFFEAVQINAENETLRRNRLNLLSQIRSICSSVADLTRIEG